LACYPGRLAIALDGPPADQTSVEESRSQSGADTRPAEDQGYQAGTETENVLGRIRRSGGWLAQWYVRTEPADRVTWGGLAGCAVFGLGVLCERLIKLRRRRIVPTDFTERFLDRLHEGRLDCGGALDHCELNPSPAARIALAAVRRWGRPASDLERAVSLAHRVETDSLRRNVGSLRRIAALAPLIGLLGTLFALGRVLDSIPPTAVAPRETIESAQGNSPTIAWGPALSNALTPVIAGIIMATLALVAYDGLLSRIENLTGALDRVGGETIDAIALAAPVSSPLPLGASPLRASPPMPASDSDGGRRLIKTAHHSYIRRDEGVDLGKRHDQPEAGF
jgi:biopolymer transport protein ExbB